MNIFTDGSGKTGKYIYVVQSKNKVKVMQKKGLTNNEAEYNGVIAALKDNAEKEITIYSDSQLIVNQLNGDYKIREARLKRLASQVKKLCEGRKIRFEWVPRESNRAGIILG